VFADIAPATQLGLGKAAAGLAILGGKIGALLFLFVWVRWTFPRFRYDQLMRIGWKVFLPISLIAVVVVAFVLQLTGWGWHGGVA
jgi:NADH-quinone oxidoreductase subunit H